jgi:protein-L-isoaspartate(D-aspartate) O-methyltransferase
MNREQLLRSLETAGTPNDVLAAMSMVQREAFVPESLAAQAWDDSALRLALGSTISQPAMVAVVLEELRLTPGLRVLEVGSGSGYLLALIYAMGSDPTGIEIDPQLAKESQGKLCGTAVVIAGDAAEVDRRPPYDRIVFSAALRNVPEWALNDLAPKGFILAPVGIDTQELVRVFADRRRERTGRLCRFVPFRQSLNG